MTFYWFRISLCAILFLGAFQQVNAQCVIDYNVNQPGIYPDTLPEGYVGQLYSEDVTFFMPLDTMNFPFTNFLIQSIAGLPFGISWTCDNFANGCNYDPAVSQYGCVNFSGTPILPGTYNIDVSIIASLGALGDVPVSYPTQVVIHPDTSSNSGFSMTNPFGCVPMTVDFANQNPGLIAYNWDFGNGNLSTAENPTPQTYNTAGTYVVTYEAYADTTTQYYLTNIDVLGIPNNWGWPGDLDPDIFIELYDTSGALIYTSATVQNQNPPVTFPIPNILLDSGTYTVHVWDEDGPPFGADDDLGSTTFEGHSASGSSTSGSTSISYTISAVSPPATATATDTVYAFDVPNIPNIDSTNLLLCTDSTSLNLQWYANGNPINGETDSCYLVTQPGNYWVISTTPAGCFASSDTINIIICDTTLTPNVSTSGNILWTDSLGSSIQWYFNGTPLPGATNSVLVAQNTGTYWVEVTLYNGCTAISDTVFINLTSVIEVEGLNKLVNIFPNPSQGVFNLEYIGETEVVSFDILDLLGHVVYSESINNNKNLWQFDLKNQAKGAYILRLNLKDQRSINKQVILD